MVIISFHPSRHINPNVGEPDLYTYGQKAAGLFHFPLAWTPPFLLIGTEVHTAWDSLSPEEKGDWCIRIVQEVTDSLGPASGAFIKRNNGILIRSSAVIEGLDKRGQLETQGFEELTSESLRDFLDRLFQADIASTGGIGLIAQVTLNVDRYIHLSNERRFSKTKNEWLISQTLPGSIFIPPEGCNSIKARAVDEEQPLRLTLGSLNKDLRAALRAVGKWANRHFTKRVHFEAVLSGSRLFLVQVDTEQEIGGFDPLEAPLTFRPGDPSKVRVFRRLDYRQSNRFCKLRNVADFETTGYKPPHNLFYATANQLQQALKKDGTSALQKEIEIITGGRLVVREDVDLHGMAGLAFNLPRTDTIKSEEAVSHIERRITFWNNNGTDLDDVCLILHGFIPAQSSAWAMYSAADRRIRIHALWGLPDGLQYLTPDEYELDLATNGWSERIHFKEFFLREQENGAWKIEPIKLGRARSKVLSRSQVSQIAELTKDIGERLGSDVHIMFFCGIPKEAGVGDVLPWYRAREFSTYEAKREKKLQRVIVKNSEDLERIDTAKPLAISLMPDIENYRNNAFINSVASFAKKHDIPVEIQGSPLAHAYYILKDAGCTVFLSYAPAYERVRSKREFGKLVRDKVVQKIGGGGEKALSFHLPPEDRAPAFFGKLIEEGLEVLRAHNGDARIAELADLYEVVRGWIESADYELSEVEAIAANKRHKVGGFAAGEVLVETGSKLSEWGGKGSGLNLDRITNPREQANLIEIPAGRLGLLARGETSVVEFAEPRLTLMLSMNDEGDLLIRSGTFSPDDQSEQLNLF